MPELVEDGPLALASSDDLARLRRRLGVLLDAYGSSPLVRSRLLTAATELGRNVIRHGRGHGRGGWVGLRLVKGETRPAVELVFEDEGPGIPNLALALEDGFSTAGGLGLGLGGSRRLLARLEVEPRAPRGVRVVALGWLDGL